jgi:hypothetical protein
MNKRPKSREETPKEGSDSAERYRTATICGRAAHNARVFRFIYMRFLQGLQTGNTILRRTFLLQYQILSKKMNRGFLS